MRTLSGLHSTNACAYRAYLMNPCAPCTHRAQASGTAVYTDDIPVEAGSLYGAYVCARVCKGKITAIRTDDALRVPGAVRFVGPSDIPGDNVVRVCGHVITCRVRARAHASACRYVRMADPLDVPGNYVVCALAHVKTSTSKHVGVLVLVHVRVRVCACVCM